MTVVGIILFVSYVFVARMYWLSLHSDLDSSLYGTTQNSFTIENFPKSCFKHI